MNNKGSLVGIAVGVFLIGLGIGYAIFGAPVQQQLQNQQNQIASLQDEVSTLKGTPVGTQGFQSMMDLTQSSTSLMQGAAMMQQGSNVMLQAQDMMRQNMTQGNAMMNWGYNMMQQGFDMMQQSSNSMQQAQSQMPSLGSGPMMQGFDNMMQNRQSMLDAADRMMQARQTMWDLHQKGMMGPMMGQQNMPMMQGITNMSQGMAMMQKHMSNMQQAQGMMGMQPMIGSGGFGYMGQMMMGPSGKGMMQGPMMGQGMMGPMMMGNQTSPMGFGGMMNIPTVQPLTMENVRRVAQDFINSLNDPNLVIKDVKEFEKNFYFIVHEKHTGKGAFEMVVWKDPTGRMAGLMPPEAGPTMMWNMKYGTFAAPVQEMIITKDKAGSLAQAYLDTNLPGTMVGDIQEFHGYYTVQTVKDGKISGMLSVNGFTGHIWHHSWHGQFIK
ncbi:MAG: hypothetical protein ACE5J2_07205 [Nitrososphaerales archaeon]